MLQILTKYVKMYWKYYVNGPLLPNQLGPFPLFLCEQFAAAIALSPSTFIDRNGASLFSLCDLLVTPILRIEWMS